MAVHYDAVRHQWVHGRQETQAPEDFVHESAEPKEPEDEAEDEAEDEPEYLPVKKAAPKKRAK